jgi:hypothetical protein
MASVLDLTNHSALVVPDNSPSIESGNGEGEWVAALIYVDNTMLSRKDENHHMRVEMFQQTTRSRIANLSHALIEKAANCKEKSDLSECLKIHGQWVSGELSTTEVESFLFS